MKVDDNPPPGTTYLKDYRPPDFLIDTVDLSFDLDDTGSRVHSVLALRRNGEHNHPLFLDGEDLKLLSIAVDGAPISATSYRLTADGLIVSTVPDRFTLTIETEINPRANAALSGLYLSSGNYCTQCEAQGFRRITYFLDRPDVLARYTTTITADKRRYPVLLSNGNLIEQQDRGDGRHRARWQDPFPKPCYLFALVAGDLGVLHDEFVTRTGRHVDLYVYAQHHNIDKCGHAMASLRRAMRWDEEQYGREYDLDRYMIVVVDDFNMGAMENKGLNVFNSKYVLAKPDTATDTDYQNIESVIGHEYFHNWSGNRVTCRDWFQLSLKEGFTVFRDQQFSAAMGSPGVKRIQDVNLLRTLQFREDAGPMAHPVRPQSYQEINNFYTVTVYNKGAEVIRMLYHLLGEAAFRRGTDRYFEEHDGRAVTTDDFVNSMEQVNNIDLSQFRLWYDQAGTPIVVASEDYQAEAQTYTLELRQYCPDTLGHGGKQPFHIPIALALLDRRGQAMALYRDGHEQGPNDTVLHLRQKQQRFRFDRIPSPPVASLLRGFSAPIKLEMERTDDDLFFLMAHDDDPFARWEAGQQLAIKQLLRLVSEHQDGMPLSIDAAFVAAFRTNLETAGNDLAFTAEMLRLPSETYVAEFLDVIDPDAIHIAHSTLRRSLAQSLKQALLANYHGNLDATGGVLTDTARVGRRALKNLCLDYLMALNHEDVRHLAMKQFETARNMTDALAALRALAGTKCAERDLVLQSFYAKWRDDPLVVDKWLAAQSTSPLADTFDRVRILTRHPAFSIKNPNKVYALLNAFAHSNPARFHAADGVPYQFIADRVIELNGFNPQVAARLVSAFNDWRRYDELRQQQMREQLERIARTPKLSPDVAEIVGKGLQDRADE